MRAATVPGRRMGAAEEPRSTVSGQVPFAVWLIVPAEVVLLSVVVFPTLMSLWLSLTSWSPTSGVNWWQAEFQWFANYGQLLLGDDRFRAALVRTIFVVVFAVAAELVVGMCLALLFFDEFPWRKIAISAVILPMMIVPVDAANAFFMLFRDVGPVNQVLGMIVGHPVRFAWLSDSNLAIVPVLLVEIWQWTPLMFLMLLTGLVALPQNQLRAAVALGASPWQLFWRVMLPLVAPVVILSIVIRSVEIFKIFDPVYILTRGGPGTSTETISMWMYDNGFVYFRIAYVAAAGFLVLVVVLAYVLLILRPVSRHTGIET
jgi:multiple sugar transport system permease protein